MDDKTRELMRELVATLETVIDGDQLYDPGNDEEQESRDTLLTDWEALKAKVRRVLEDERETVIGTVGVDAGMVWIGDPCYVIGEDAHHAPQSWEEFLEALHDHEDGELAGVSEALKDYGQGVGLAIPSGYGDGLYEVRAVIVPDDLNPGGEVVKSVTVTFIEDDDEDAS